MAETTKIEALTALRDAVKEGGAKPTTIIELCARADLSCSFVLRAYNGSLDAARDMHNSVLPEWAWLSDLGERDRRYFEVENSENCFIAYESIPARAWLLAILEALIAEGRK